jgi:hypothetical protein
MLFGGLVGEQTLGNGYDGEEGYDTVPTCLIYYDTSAHIPPYD